MEINGLIKNENTVKDSHQKLLMNGNIMGSLIRSFELVIIIIGNYY